MRKPTVVTTIAIWVGTAGLARAAVAAGPLVTDIHPLSPPAGATTVSAGNEPHLAGGGQAVAEGNFPGVSGTFGGSAQQALLWSYPGGTAVDLQPTLLTGFKDTFAYATDGTQQAGYGDRPSSDGVVHAHAVVWSGTAASAVDLTPTTFGYTIYTSYVNGVGGGQQVGSAAGAALVSQGYHPTLWAGTAASAVDLNPAAIVGPLGGGGAFGTDGVHQVGGAGGAPTGNYAHAILWAGTAASAVDLHPAASLNIYSSVAVAVCDGQEVGYGNSTVSSGGNPVHALLWSGTAASCVDLNPTEIPGLLYSEAFGTNGRQEVGWANGTYRTPDGDLLYSPHRAVLWSGSAASAVDLSTSLPADGTWAASDAYAIDAAGTVTGTAQGTYQGTTGYFAVTWSTAALPEPAAGVIGLAAVGLLRGRRRQ